MVAKFPEDLSSVLISVAKATAAKKAKITSQEDDLAIGQRVGQFTVWQT